MKLTATFENVTNGIFDILYKGHATEVIRLTNAIYVAFYMQVKWGGGGGGGGGYSTHLPESCPPLELVNRCESKTSDAPQAF